MEEKKFSHFSAMLNFLLVFIFLGFFLYLVPSFLSYLLLFLIAISFSIAFILSLLKIPGVSFVLDFDGWAEGTIFLFLKIKNESLRLFGLPRNYTIKNEDVDCIIKTKFLFLNRYEIFYYRKKVLSYFKIYIFFWNIEKNFPSDKVVVLPGLFSSILVSYFRGGLFLAMYRKRGLFINYFQSLYFKRKESFVEMELFKKDSYLNGTGYICDFRYANSIAIMVKQKGYFGINPFEFSRLSLYSSINPYFSKLSNGFTLKGYSIPVIMARLSSNEISFYFAGTIFILPWIDCSEIIVKNKNRKSLTFVHSCKDAPKGITYFPGLNENIQTITDQMKKFTKITYID